MLTFERNPQFSNALANSASPYLRQHAHNPVFWYPWGPEALHRARVENKPILLSIGYSTCYWCHVMEREVFENVSIAALMNRLFVNIKVDREEYPEIDAIYMTARQVMTRQGGWPNNVFLTPDLEPFYAGGTFGPADAYGQPAFPRLLEWLNHRWQEHQSEAQKTAGDVMDTVRQLLVFAPSGEKTVAVGEQAAQLFSLLQAHYDSRTGGFFQAPKFPHECFLGFLLGYHEQTGNRPALEMVMHSLEKMAAGGIYDHVGCGFHRYAVDREWYVPHFEKMLYTQALMARACTDAARLADNPYLADIARSVLDFVSGPFTDARGAFYAAIDAETDGVEGAYYAWTAQELQSLLGPEETHFFTHFYALADIPQFPGHKHVQGQVIIARQPLNAAAHEQRMPYVAVAALTGQVMNKLLGVRNRREPPNLDNKIIVSWNGLMIDAFAHAGKVLGEPRYIAIARKAANFLLENMLDNDGQLQRIFAGTRAQVDATLEDYAFFIKGLLSLWRAASGEKMRNSAVLLAERVEELFSDSTAPGYFFTQSSDQLPVRIKSSEDSTLPNANAVMAHNFIDLFEITGDASYRHKAQALVEHFLRGRENMTPEYGTMLHAALRLEALAGGKAITMPETFDYARAVAVPALPNDAVTVSSAFVPPHPQPGQECELAITLAIKAGWHINANPSNQPFLIPTQLDVQGDGVELLGVEYPEPAYIRAQEWEQPLWVYERTVRIIARLRLAAKGNKRPPIRAMLRFQPCSADICQLPQDMSFTL